MNETISKNRTAIMGIAMISVMLVHQLFFYGNPFVDFFHLYGLWGVDVFLFVSGFGMVHSLRKNSISTFYKNRCKRLVPACLIVGIFKYVFMLMGFKEHTNDNVVLLITNVYLWYIYAIIVYYIMSPWLYKLILKYGVVIFILSCVLSFCFHYIPFEDSPLYLINHIGWISSRLPVFVLGMYLTIYPLKISTKIIILIGLIIFILCMVLKLGATMVKYQWSIPHIYLLLLPAIPMLCITFGKLKELADRIKIGWFINLMGTYSLELYLWHEYIYKNIYFHQWLGDLNHYTQCILAICLIMLFVVLTSHIAKIIQLQINKVF